MNLKKYALIIRCVIGFFCLSQIAHADFSTTVTLNGVSNTYSFPDAESALTVNRAKYQNDFKNPVTGQLPTSTVGQITQFIFQGESLTSIQTTSTSLVIAPVPGASNDFITLSGSGLYNQLVSFLANGTIPSGATSGLSATSIENLNKIIATIPVSNQALADSLKLAIATANTSTGTDPGTDLQQIAQKYADNGVTCNINRNDKICARVQATAAIAGNPASLMGTMVDQIFLQTSGDMVGKPKKSAASSDRKKSAFAVGVQYGHYSLAGATVDTVTVPLSYTARLNTNNQLIFSVPLTYVNTQGVTSYQAGGGVAYKYQFLDNWTLTPAINYAYRGTPNSGNALNRTEGHLIAGTLTSKYSYDFDPEDSKSFKIALTTMAGYFQSLNMSTQIGSRTFQTSGHVADFVVKNGLALNKHLGKFNVSAFVTDTEYFGSQLFFEQYNEVGLALHPEYKGKLFSALSVSANYLFSFAKGQHGDLEGFRLNLGYQF